MIYTRRQMRKKLALVLVLGILMGWTLHVLTTNLIIRHYESKPIVLGAVVYASEEKAQTYTVRVWKFSGVPAPAWEFKGGVALWNRPELVKRLFIARFKPSPGYYYSYQVISPDGKYKQGRFFVAEKPNRSAKGLFCTVAYASELHSPKEWYERESKRIVEEFDLELPEILPFGKRPSPGKTYQTPTQDTFSKEGLTTAFQIIRQSLKLTPGLYNCIIITPAGKTITIEFIITKNAVMVECPYSQSLSNIDEAG